MQAPIRRLLVFGLVTTVLAYIFFLVLNMASYPADRLLHQYKTVWIAEEALRELIAHLPIVIASSILAAFATIPTGGTNLSMSNDVLVGTVGRLMILFLLFTLVYTGLDIGLQPKLNRDRHNRLYLSSLARSYLERGDLAESRGEQEEALEFYRNYLSIVEHNPSIRRKAEIIEGDIEIERGEEQKSPQEEAPQSRHERYRDFTPTELIRQSRDALEEEEDPFTAHFLAQLALELDENREDAKRLAARAWSAIGEMEPEREEREAHSLYEAKVRGYRELQEGRPVEAYYTFLELSRRAPDDPDVREYLEESRREAREVSFFLDEAEETDTMPGLRTIVYREPKPEEGESSIVYIDKMVRRGAVAWLHRVEIISFTEEGELVRRLAARYAKLSSRVSSDGQGYSLLIFRGIDRNESEISMRPRIEEGEAAGEETLLEVHRSTAPLEEISHLSMHRDFLRRLSLIELFRVERTYERYGHPKSSVQIALLMRLLGPFLLLVSCLFSVGIGLRLRPRGGRAPMLLLPFLALVPFVVERILALLEYGHRIIFSGLLRMIGFSGSLLCLLLIQGILLFIAIYHIARYREA